MSDNARLVSLRELAQELEARDPSPDRDELLRSVRERISEIEVGPASGVTWHLPRPDLFDDVPAEPTHVRLSTREEEWDTAIWLPEERNPLEFEP